MVESPLDVIEGFKVFWDILLGLFDENFLNIVIIILVDPVSAPVPVGMAELCRIRSDVLIGAGGTFAA